MDLNRIVVLFGLFAGLAGAEVTPWEVLCNNAMDKLTKQLKKEVTIAENQERLCTACAAFAYADYLLLSSRGSSKGEQLKVGDISLGSSNASGVMKQDSLSVREYFTAQIADLLVNTGFVFTAIGDNHAE